MFCECLQLSNGELDCNYTESTRRIFSTTEVSFISSTSLLSSTLRVASTTEDSSQIPTDMPSVYTSTITQTVPTGTTTESSFMSSTIEVLDLSKSTEEVPITSSSFDSSTPSVTSEHSSISTEHFSASTQDETESTTESSSSIFTTRSSMPSKTTKFRPCPPDQTSRTTTMKSTTDSTSSEATSSTFHYESTSSTYDSTPFDSTSTQAALKTTTDEQSTSASTSITTQMPIESSTSEITNEMIETTPLNDISTQFDVSKLTTNIGYTTTFGYSTTATTDEITSQSTSTQMSTSEESTIKSGETTLKGEATSEKVETTSMKAEITSTKDETDEAQKTTQKITSTDVEFETTTPTTSSSYQPPMTTEDMFTLTPSEVANMTDCRNLKCFNGGSCVVTSEGPKCVCRFDRQDPHCRTLIRIRNAAFAGDSYLSHLIYSDSHPDFDIKPLDSILSINIQLKARTRATDGLILLAIAQGQKGGHYTALFLHKGLLQFQFSCGLQTMLLSELEAPINTGNEFTVQVALDFSRNHSHCNASLRINDTLAMSGDQPTWLGVKALGRTKTISSIWLHLGGSPQTPVVLMSELPGGQGFTGCLHTLRINEEPKEIFRHGFFLLFITVINFYHYFKIFN